MSEIQIRYWRPPDRLQLFRQRLVLDRPDCKVTLAETWTPDRALEVAGEIVFEPGAPIVWFVFPGAWHDLGRFHLVDGTFTGYYANIIAPAKLDGADWEIRDLCLDLWVSSKGAFHVLDQDEFEEAAGKAWIDEPTARRAREELERLLDGLKNGRWPPAIARELDLQRVRALLDDD